MGWRGRQPRCGQSKPRRTQCVWASGACREIKGSDVTHRGCPVSSCLSQVQVSEIRAQSTEGTAGEELINGDTGRGYRLDQDDCPVHPAKGYHPSLVGKNSRFRSALLIHPA